MNVVLKNNSPAITIYGDNAKVDNNKLCSSNRFYICEIICWNIFLKNSSFFN